MRATTPLLGTTAGLLLLLALALPSATVLSGCDSDNGCDDSRATEVVVEFEGTDGVQAVCEVARTTPCASESQIVTATVPDQANLGAVTEAVVSCVGQSSSGTLRLRMLLKDSSGEFREFQVAEIDGPGREIIVGFP